MLTTENSFRRLIIENKSNRNAFGAFKLMVYYFYYRYTVELGISTLNTLETRFVNVFFVLFIWGIIRFLLMFVFDYLVWFIRLLYAFNLFYRKQTHL